MGSNVLEKSWELLDCATLAAVYHLASGGPSHAVCGEITQPLRVQPTGSQTIDGVGR